MKTLRKLLVLIMAISLAVPVPVTAQAAYIKGSLTGTQRYDIAYQYLDILNASRKAKGLKELKMDRSLTNYAMQRSAEQTALYGHKRPDGSGCFDNDLMKNRYAGEICFITTASQLNGQAVFNTFHSSKEHDDIMHHKAMTSIGVGIIETQGHGFLVACSLSDGGTEMPKPTQNPRKTWTFNVKPEYFNGVFEGKWETFTEGGVPRNAVIYGTNQRLPLKPYTYTIDQSVISGIKSSDPSVLTVSGEKLIPKKAGNTTLTASVAGKSISTIVTVSKNSAAVSPTTTQTQQTEPAKQDTPKKITLTGTYELRVKSDRNRAVTVKNSRLTENTQLCLQNKGAGEIQAFSFKKHSDGTVSMISVYSDMAISSVKGSSDTAAVTLKEFENSNAEQRWYIMQYSDGSVSFLNKANGKALNLPGGKIDIGTTLQAYKPNGSFAQRFTLKKIAEQEHSWTGIYNIRYAGNQAYVLDIAGSSKNTRANVQLYKSNGTNAQKFQVLYAGDGWYRIRNVGSGMVLDISGGSKKAGANIQQYKWKGSDGQRWKFTKHRDGSVTITSKLGTALDLYGAIVKNGNNIHSYTLNGTTAQRWVFSRV